MSNRVVQRPRWLAYGLPVFLLVGLLLQACVPAAAPAAQEPAAGEASEEAASNVTVYGTELPADARPYDEQV